MISGEKIRLDVHNILYEIINFDISIGFLTKVIFLYFLHSLINLFVGFDPAINNFISLSFNQTFFKTFFISQFKALIFGSYQREPKKIKLYL